MKKIGVNGFGRIGRYFTRISLENPNIDVAVVNDIFDIKTLFHLFKYDSIHGKLRKEISLKGNKIILSNGKEIEFISVKDPEKIKWSDYGVDIVLESTGKFRTKEEVSKHLIGGAKKIILSSPAKDSSLKTIVLGVNDEKNK